MSLTFDTNPLIVWISSWESILLRGTYHLLLGGLILYANAEQSLQTLCPGLRASWYLIHQLGRGIFLMIYDYLVSQDSICQYAHQALGNSLLTSQSCWKTWSDWEQRFLMSRDMQPLPRHACNSACVTFLKGNHGAWSSS